MPPGQPQPNTNKPLTTTQYQQTVSNLNQLINDWGKPEPMWNY